ncbi:proline racemase family protein [Companilactobacillus sp.]|uniref:proline racemase family protein n=1 Tax=Companilactobacillus sp. TaxID=2767905 RepID=UPI0025BE796C|nr:proline racemase family protein [Companilactobacillus sp.]MCH4010138.1 proline racemase family protein [Companilactobacillus sp.]MCH4052186.1 proline racemase family protein [Companilactobacillus sp.]MCH4078080.1 proline racemase family protein [Companilactobacillus sp.]MCH4126656.1 proline racemase family protein [Companilactobacillus sp.]MCH4132241.1 proline racemase family protein [Companilactobacillus sp.]
MEFTKMMTAIDSHTAGEAARIITSGGPILKGNSIAEKKQYLIDHYDSVRTSVMLEPRGHNEMFGAFLVDAMNPEADYGIIFMDTGGYLNMCGHNTIAAVTAIVETGMVDVEPGAKEKKVVLDTPAGLIHAVAHLDGEHVTSVSFQNVPAFLYKKDVVVDVPDLGKIKLDISFGGSFFAILPVAEINEKIEPDNSQALADAGMKILHAVNDQVKVQHPELKHIHTVDLVEMYGDPKDAESTKQNVVIFGDGQVDRSPCGTGTSAKLATLHAKGELGIDEQFVYESILKTKFYGRIVKETKAGDLPAVIPEITGSAWITGFNQFVFDPTDPLSDGFELK